VIVFNGEFVSAETGEEESVYARGLIEATRLVRKMKDGDSLVLNANEESEF
jgi:hypothetical protein